MHIPDGFLDHKTASGLGLAAATVMAYAANKVHQAVTSPVMQKALAVAGKNIKSIATKTKQSLSVNGIEYLAKIGMVASLVFSAQMFNFPISSGTSGHLLGGVLAALLLGPWGGSIALASVLIVQALFYADGGILALGANIINMAVLGCIVSYYIYDLLKKSKINLQIIIFVTAWFSVVLAASTCAIELAISGTYPLQEAFIAMVKVHSIIGIFEALITIALINLVQKIMSWEVK